MSKMKDATIKGFTPPDDSRRIILSCGDAVNEKQWNDPQEVA